MNLMECAAYQAGELANCRKNNYDLKNEAGRIEQTISLALEDYEGQQRLAQQQQQQQDEPTILFNSCANKNDRTDNNSNSSSSSSSIKTEADVEEKQSDIFLSSLKSTDGAIRGANMMPIEIDCVTLLDTRKENNENNELEVVDGDRSDENDKVIRTSGHVVNLLGTAATEGDVSQPAYDDALQRAPLSERWSPLGANYDDAINPSLEPLRPEDESEYYLISPADSRLLDSQELVGANANELGRLRNIEEEQEVLTSSLLALTSHFAHVQLRVRQIVEAPAQERDELLKDLEDFAFQGIPEPTVITNTLSCCEDGSQISGTPDTNACNEIDFGLINQMKCQLNELEVLAYESGAPVMPQHILLEKQKIIIDELKSKLNLQLNESQLPELSAEELKNQVDSAIGEFVGPLKMKEQLVVQLKTQIADLERFIAFLQCDSDGSKPKMMPNGVVSVSDGFVSSKLYEVYNSYAAKKKQEQQLQQQELQPMQKSHNQPTAKAAVTTKALNTLNNAPCLHAQPEEMMSATAAPNGSSVRESLSNKAQGLLEKASLLMQMFASMHLMPAKSEPFEKNSLKKTSKGNHWGDIRAQLEVDIQEVASLAGSLSCDCGKLPLANVALKRNCQMSKVRRNISATTTTTTMTVAHSLQQEETLTAVASINSSDSDKDAYERYEWHRPSSAMCSASISRELTQVVRKNFAKRLQQLLQHGLRVETESSTSSLIVPFMRCFNPMPHFSPPLSSTPAATSATAAHVGNEAVGQRAVAIRSIEASANYNAAHRSSIFGYGRPMHAWELILEYYYLKHGDEYNNMPARKLSQSFNLDIVDGEAVTAKQSLLSAIGMIVAMHGPYKRSFDAHFKAFVCAGLNAHLLVEWLTLILKCNELIEVYYAPNSYAARTGFRDSLRSIDLLTKYDFGLPVDLAIRHFRNL